MSTVPTAQGTGVGGSERPTPPNLASPDGRHHARPHEGAGAVEVAASSSGERWRGRTCEGGACQWRGPARPSVPARFRTVGKSPKDTRNSKQCRASNQ